jgi:hypothetical protein
MAEHDYVIANQNGANTRSDLNNALAAIVSNNSKATAPTTTYAFMWWADTANDILKQRNAADSAWISILTLSTGTPSVATGASELGDLSDANTTATSNLGLGTGAVDAITTGDYNVGVGGNALTATTSGEQNTAVGVEALQANTSGHSCVAFGYRALLNNTTAAYNVAFGKRALQANTTGASNTAVGSDSLISNTTGAENTAVGYQALYGNTTAQENTAVGHYALRNSTGSWNTAVGDNAGDAVTSGANNLLLGRRSGTSGAPSGAVTTASHVLCLGDDNISNFYCADTSISSSDRRDKADIEDFSAGLDFINQMRPVTYRWDKRSWYEDGVPNGSNKKDKLNLGFISQEVQELEQALGFSTNKDDELICNTNEDDSAIGLKYERLVPILVNAIKELSAKVEALENA